MSKVSADLVDIVRDFMVAHRVTRRVAARHRSGALRFEELHELISDDDGSALFRLKERSHALFRPRDAKSALSSRGEALFDLAVGSLFHEAMKFRENFYQHEIYGPRMRALRSGTKSTSDGLFREFEKILASESARLEEGLHETENLMAQTRELLRGLLAEHVHNGFVARYLVENRAQVDAVFGCSLDSLFEEIAGGAAAGFELAGRSYFESGFYQEAECVLAEAIERGGTSEEIERLSQYARGMAAYLAADYAECVLRLSEWFDGVPTALPELAEIARSAVSRIGHLAEGRDRDRITADANRLVERLSAAVPSA